jgi:cell division protein ZapA
LYIRKTALPSTAVSRYSGFVPDPQGVRVEIFDQVYHLRVGNDSDAEQIRKAAAYVDAKIRSVAAKTRDVDSLRLAVLAALHIADEYHTLQSKHEDLQDKIEQRSAALGRLLDRELRSAS